jgi:UDP:flavonoid glycosyltransferase YjiC (YdhE family)
MRVLLSTIGSRGDVQPLVALAVELKARGHDARLCVPPDFHGWIANLGFLVTPIGPYLRSTAKLGSSTTVTPEQRRQMAAGSIAAQFETIAAAAGAGAPQVVIPQHYDQHYWAQRVHQLGIGTAHAFGAPTVESLTSALERALQPDVATRSRRVAASMRGDGARRAAEHLSRMAGPTQAS